MNRQRDSKGRFISNQGLTSGSKETNVVDAGNEFHMRTLSAVVSRLQLANLAGLQFEGERDLYEVFGYKKNLKPEDFLAKYVRQDVASRIVDAPPGATWSNPPMMKDSDALWTKWQELEKKTKMWNAMFRADKLARLNPFSLMLFGFDDGGSLRSQVSKASELLYIRALGSRQVTQVNIDSNVRSARFGMPDTYKIKFDNPKTRTADGNGATSDETQELVIHHSRIVHIAENPLEDLIYGTPIMERVYNLLDDLLKVAGGASETYWLTSNRGMQADIDKDMDVDPADAAALSDEIEEYQHQLRRFIRTRGVKMNVLDAGVVDPKAPFEVIMSLISGTTGIPRRILLGSEAGQLASEQDRANWAERIEERRTLFATPWILEPTVALLQSAGLLDEGDVEWVWPSAFIQNPLEESQTMAQTARAIGNISRQTGNQVPMQLTSREEGRAIIGLEGDLEESELLDTTPPDQDPTSGPEEEEEEDRKEREEDEDTDQ